MNPRQKVLFTQLQIASVGVLLAAFGWMWSETWLKVFGVCIFVYGLLRAWIFSRVISQQDENEEPMDLSLDLSPEDEEDSGEYPMDEWEEAFMRRFGQSKMMRAMEAELDEKKAKNPDSSRPGQPPKQTKIPDLNSSQSPSPKS
ncbi:hypothetical protein [Allobaculum sp. JKK-2023]|uniref:hypothetical protein n=1 Tax=Allobaculum sp. JKK-2023 TaxID=3108943 RepID=UPI002B05696C|nr:hypothetical protein [Allobaculum sp. JKK-2023]